MMAKESRKNIRYILASGSPRRSDLLRQVRIKFEVMVSDADESTDKTVPFEVVLELSRKKCEAVAREAADAYEPSGDGDDTTVVIAADTVVACDGAILGKPGSGQQAVNMLMTLSGNTHCVFTGVTFCVIRHSDGAAESNLEYVSFCEETKVTMCPFSEEEAMAYVETGEPMDKAGSYGIQGLGALLVERIEGDYNNVVGLPLSRLCREIKLHTTFPDISETSL